MTGATRSRASIWLLAVLLIALSVFAAWRVIALTQAEYWAASDPARALGWVPDHPQALLTLVDTQLAAGHRDAASASARRLLEAEPRE